MNDPWQILAAKTILTLRVEHRNYMRALDDLCAQIQVAAPGEVIVLVGPSRVGKLRVLMDALAQLLRANPGRDDDMPFVYIETQNASKDGDLSTKDFMHTSCVAIRHPIYGVPRPDDPHGQKFDALIESTSQTTLRRAFEFYLPIRKTRYIVMDEAHHFAYVRGGKENAAKVLDSLKCLANKTGCVLILVGSYQLLPLLALAPHLLGRELAQEFPRYRDDDEGDLLVFEGILDEYSKHFKFENATENLRQWNDLLYAHSFGCIGHLSKWLRAALARMASRQIEFITRDVLLATRLPEMQQASILAEILQGEKDMAHDRASKQSSAPPQEEKPKTRAGKNRPFVAKPRRHKAKGRST